MKFLKIGLATIFSITFSLSVFTLDLDGESFNLSGKITSVEIKDGGGVIHVSSEAGRYGLSLIHI